MSQFRTYALAAFACSALVAAANATTPDLPIAPRAVAPAIATAPAGGAGAVNPMGLAAPAAQAPAVQWIAREADGSVLNVLLAWAPLGGWTFRPEHWSVNNDFPIQGGAIFGTDFRSAVRALLETTATSGAPVQPCFYSNKVLRVIPRTDSCDRGATQAVVAAPNEAAK